jgi:hypothetical protein
MTTSLALRTGGASRVAVAEPWLTAIAAIRASADRYEALSGV